MGKVLLLVLVGIVIFLIVATIRSPEKILPTSEIKRLTRSFDACPEPFVFQLPVNINKATSILYPGQVRGEDYKAHGGFRFDTFLPSEITVTAPYDAQVIAGARYLADTGEIQYTFDFAHPCGIQYRFGHLLTPTPKFQAIAEKFPLPEGLDSRTTSVDPPIEVRRGEVIATAVGLTGGGPSDLGGINTFVDWGVYDYRQKTNLQKTPLGLQHMILILTNMLSAGLIGFLRKTGEKYYPCLHPIPKAAQKAIIANNAQPRGQS
ncbi:MAG: hypothetical protein NUV69_03675 [Candidatus Curtissbacteria bacterium]|nr:hypothetical protein [Candidatus Curtissbacteria bacterium]